MPDRIRTTALPPRPSAARLPYLDLRGEGLPSHRPNRGRCGREARARRVAPRTRLESCPRGFGDRPSHCLEARVANHRAGVHRICYGEDAIELRVVGDAARLAVGAFRKSTA